MEWVSSARNSSFLSVAFVVLPSPLFISYASAALHKPNRAFIYENSIRTCKKQTVTLKASPHLILFTFRSTAGYFQNVAEKLVTLLTNARFSTVSLWHCRQLCFSKLQKKMFISDDSLLPEYDSWSLSFIFHSSVRTSSHWLQISHLSYIMYCCGSSFFIC